MLPWGGQSVRLKEVEPWVSSAGSQVTCRPRAPPPEARKSPGRKVLGGHPHPRGIGYASQCCPHCPGAGEVPSAAATGPRKGAPGHHAVREAAHTCV